ncbi:helix-turn-helix transcriptional regulator [Staphylococcus hominis]|uniref:helix-turn-helix transcriptional regulator n=1 Tax=Staphylococcus hominis TaxID=1290 RepID=UPI00098A3579|nr:helix-turn-helix transcriptional regulator [Staphylococcus hominis]MBJ6366338.1 helix-turn-helix transcriptional regulator [Staphylococcus hominis]MCI2870191.1 helix-turn-helix transcriptional regulator [Staphylococcus hominis]MDS3837896.1 helix-turn-helix transcriptional regulator [Staphylococcus hominis]MDS3894745.1 helix-turn-helix transcriptional regulator [Staphylococcus hominis]
MNNNLKYFRKKSNLSQEELSIKVNVTRQTISLIELGKYNPTLKLCIDIAYALNTDLNELFWKSGEKNAK